MSTMPIRDVSLFVSVMGDGYPLLLMHAGPGLDHTTLLSLEKIRQRGIRRFMVARFTGVCRQGD